MAVAVKKVKARVRGAPPERDSWGYKLRQRRLRLEPRITLADLARRTGLSIGYLSEIERGREPTPHVKALLMGELGMVEPVLDAAPAPLGAVLDPRAARLGAVLAVVREATLEEMGRATNLDMDEVRHGLRVLSSHLAPLGMRVLEDGMSACLQPRKDLSAVPAVLTRRRRRPPLTQLQMAILMMAVYWDDGLTVARVDRIRRLGEGRPNVNSWSVVQALVDKGFLVQQPEGYTYRPTHLLLDLTPGLETIEQMRAWLHEGADGQYGWALEAPEDREANQEEAAATGRATRPVTRADAQAMAEGLLGEVGAEASTD